MSSSDFLGHKLTQQQMQDAKTFMPGTTEVVEAGNVLVIRDANGQEIAVEARDTSEVLDFLRAFSDYHLARMQSVTGVAIDALWANLQAKWSALPNHISHELMRHRLGASANTRPGL